jgi:predicted MFS family arabinose efflux permease
MKLSAIPSRNPSAIWSVTFFILFGTLFSLFGSQNMLLPIMAIHFQNHGLSEAEIGVIFGTFCAASVVARLLTARLANWLGELTLFKAALLTAAIGNALTLIDDTFTIYLVTRIINGAGIGAASTILIALASKIIPPAKLADGLGKLALGGSTALAVGPFLGLTISDIGGFPLVLVATCLLLSAGFTAVATRKPSDFQLQNQSASPVSLSSLKDSATTSPTDPLKASERRLIAGTELLLPALLSLLLGGGCCGIYVYSVLYLDEKGIGGVASFFFLATAGIVATRLFAGKIHDRLGHLYVITPSSLLIFTSMILMLLFPSNLVIKLSAVCFGLGMGALYPSLQALIVSYATTNNRTLAVALFLNGYDVGNALNTVAMGMLAGFFHTYRMVYLGCSVFIMALTLIYLLCPIFNKGRRA